MLRDIIVAVLFGGAVAGCGLLIAGAWLVQSFASRGRVTRRTAAVSVLKPLHGVEPGLFENLASFCRQDHEGTVQIVFGVADPGDPAIAVVETLRAAFPEREIDLVVDGRTAGSNPKVANLINMSPRVRHGIVVVSDSDIRVAPDYLSRIVEALGEAGAATCLYVGIAGKSQASRLARLHIDGHFLPSVLVGLRLKLAQPCFGSTIAMRADTLSAIGGFAAFADALADDYAIGQALRARGRPVAVPPMVVGHVCSEAGLGELWRHELRWALTIRSIDPTGYLGWVVTHPFALAVVALAIGGGLPALALAGGALACRCAVLKAVERTHGVPPHPYWLVPLRDLLSFAIFAAAFAVREVDWRGRRYRLMSDGALKPERRQNAQ